MPSLPIDDSSLIINTLEFRWPFGRDVANLKDVGAGSPYFDMGSRLGCASGTLLEPQHRSPGFGHGKSVSGIGDLDARLLYLPYVKKKTILAVGLEAFFDTATSGRPRVGQDLARTHGDRRLSRPGRTRKPVRARLPVRVRRCRLGRSRRHQPQPARLLLRVGPGGRQELADRRSRQVIFDHEKRHHTRD